MNKTIRTNKYVNFKMKPLYIAKPNETIYYRIFKFNFFEIDDFFDLDVKDEIESIVVSDINDYNQIDLIVRLCKVILYPINFHCSKGKNVPINIINFVEKENIIYYITKDEF